MGKKFSVILNLNLFVFCLVTFDSAAHAREEHQLGNCNAFINGRTLFVNGTEIANTIDIKGSERQIQIICDGVTESFNGIEVVTIEAGDGDDTVNVNNNDGFLDEIKITVLGQAGDDIFEWSKVQEIRPARQTLFDHSFDGGFGDDLLLITTSVLDEKFDIVPGREENSVEVEVMDIAQKTKLADIRGSELEILNVKMGDGNDQATISHLPEISLNILGQEGDEKVTLTEILIEILPLGPPATLVDLGGGLDEVVIGGSPVSEKWEIAGVLDQGIPDPEIRVIDPLTGLVAAQLQVQHTEEIAIQTKAGDDTVNVSWVAARMSDLTLLQVDSGEDEDVFNVILSPPPDDGLPVLQEVQIARLQLISGSGSDQVNFNHFGGSWFNLSFTADTGKGDDAVSALLGPPPDDGLPGPEGIRQLNFDIDTGKEDDFVSLKNETNGEFFYVFFDADFKGGDDLFEGSGQIQRAELLPGPGRDTAHITRNFISFVSAFEEVEIID